MKKNMKRGTFLYKLYLYYSLYFKEKYYIKRNQYSQWGEDIEINNFFKKKKFGRYVDIGCFHPIRHSNTCLLFNRGWSGINIDLNPTAIDFFNIMRPKDKNIVAGVSNKKGIKKKIYFEHFFSTLNSFYPKHINNLKVKHTSKKIITKTFSNIVQENFNFLNIDCEGEDLKILKTINFKYYTPELICIEIDNKKKISTFFKFLKKSGYFFLKKKKLSYLFYRKK